MAACIVFALNQPNYIDMWREHGLGEEPLQIEFLRWFVCHISGRMGMAYIPLGVQHININ